VAFDSIAAAHDSRKASGMTYAGKLRGAKVSADTSATGDRVQAVRRAEVTPARACEIVLAMAVLFGAVGFLAGRYMSIPPF
jgi:hypothetical protein